MDSPSLSEQEEARLNELYRDVKDVVGTFYLGAMTLISGDTEAKVKWCKLGYPKVSKKLANFELEWKQFKNRV